MPCRHSYVVHWKGTHHKHGTGAISTSKRIKGASNQMDDEEERLGKEGATRKSEDGHFLQIAKELMEVSNSSNLTKAVTSKSHALCLFRMRNKSKRRRVEMLKS